MPTYVYKFVETGETIDVQQAFTDDALSEAVHPSSGHKMQVKKVFQPVGVTFKGGGFYKTDSRGGSSKSSSNADSATGTDTPTTDKPTTPTTDKPTTPTTGKPTDKPTATDKPKAPAAPSTPAPSTASAT